MIALRVIKIQECSLLLQIYKVPYIQPRFNEPLYNKVLERYSPTQPFQMYETGPRRNEPMISLVPWRFVKSRFHCIFLF